MKFHVVYSLDFICIQIGVVPNNHTTSRKCRSSPSFKQILLQFIRITTKHSFMGARTEMSALIWLTANWQLLICKNLQAEHAYFIYSYYFMYSWGKMLKRQFQAKLSFFYKYNHWIETYQNICYNFIIKHSLCESFVNVINYSLLQFKALID